MGVFIHYAFINVVNSLSGFQVTTQSVQGLLMSETKVAWDKLVGNVLILESHIMDLWREKDAEFEKEHSKFHTFLKEAASNPPSPLTAMEIATGYYHAIIELMRRRGFLRFKPPRSFGVKHDE